jgi:hypothetical protein
MKITASATSLNVDDVAASSAFWWTISVSPRSWRQTVCLVTREDAHMKGERALQVTDPNGVIVQLVDWKAQLAPETTLRRSKPTPSRSQEASAMVGPMTNTYSGQLPNAPLAESYPMIPSHLSTTQTEATMAVYPAALPQTTLAHDPARTLGVVGLVLAIFANVIGLVVSIVAFTKSKRAGFKNGVALAGIVIGAITTLGVLSVAIVGGVAAKGLVDTCTELGPGQHVVNGVTYTCG